MANHSSPPPNDPRGVLSRLDPAIRRFGRFLHHAGGALRRRGLWVVFGLIGGIIGGTVVAITTKPPVQTVHYYKATSVLAVAKTAEPLDKSDPLVWTFQLAQRSLLAPTFQQAVGKRTKQSTASVANHIQGVPDFSGQTFSVTAVSTDPIVASNLSFAAADELNAEMTRQNDKAFNKAKSAARFELLRTKNRLAEVSRDLRTESDPVGSLSAQLKAIGLHTTRLYTAVAGYDKPPEQAQLVVMQGPSAIEINRKAFLRRWSTGASTTRRVIALSQPNAPESFTSTVNAPDAPSKNRVADTDLPDPKAPSPIQPIGLGALAGLVMGIAAVTFGEAWDERLHDAESTEAVSGAPILAEIPHLRRRATRDLITGGGVGRTAQAATRYGEAATMIASDLALRHAPVAARPASLGAGADDGGPRAPVLMITSASPTEGKSTSTAVLARAFAARGFRVLAVDADYHRTSLRKLLRPIPNLVHPDHPEVTRVDGVQLIGVPRNPTSPALANTELLRQIQRWRSDYDIILVDTPPILATNDATDLVNRVDAVVLLARADQTLGPALERASNLVRRFHASPLGVILTDVDDRHVEATYGDPATYPG